MALKYGIGSARRFTRVSTALMSPVIPAAPSKCPMFGLADPTTNGLVADLPCANTSLSAVISITSPRAVPDP